MQSQLPQELQRELQQSAKVDEKPGKVKKVEKPLLPLLPLLGVMPAMHDNKGLVYF